MVSREKGEIDRVKCFKYLVAVNKLTDKKYYDTVIKAVESNNKELFKKMCMEAGVPEDLIEPITHIAFQVGSRSIWFI